MKLTEPMQAVLRAIGHMETHLKDPITVPEAATRAGYSAGHFCAIFSQHTRHSPYDYLIRRRMSQAAQDLAQQPGRKVVDIALDYQFESHEGFTRAFRRMMSACPGEVQSTGYFPYSCFLPPITNRHLACLADEKGLVPEFRAELPAQAVEKRPAMEIPLWLKSDQPGRPPTRTQIRYVVFNLNHHNNMSSALDWIFHTWLFISAESLAENCVYTHLQEGLCQLFLPIS